MYKQTETNPINISNCVRSADTIDMDKKSYIPFIFLVNKDYPNLSTLLRDLDR